MIHVLSVDLLLMHVEHVQLVWRELPDLRRQEAQILYSSLDGFFPGELFSVTSGVSGGFTAGLKGPNAAVAAFSMALQAFEYAPSVSVAANFET